MLANDIVQVGSTLKTSLKLYVFAVTTSSATLQRDLIFSAVVPGPAMIKIFGFLAKRLHVPYFSLNGSVIKYQRIQRLLFARMQMYKGMCEYSVAALFLCRCCAFRLPSWLNRALVASLQFLNMTCVLSTGPRANHFLGFVPSQFSEIARMDISICFVLTSTSCAAECPA